MQCPGDRLFDFLDRRLDESDRSALEKHLATCGECARRAEEHTRVWDALGDMDAPQPDAQLRGRVMDAVERECAADRESVTAPRVVPAILRRVLVPLAAAAAVLIVVGLLQHRSGPHVDQPGVRVHWGRPRSDAAAGRRAAVRGIG